MKVEALAIGVPIVEADVRIRYFALILSVAQHAIALYLVLFGSPRHHIAIELFCMSFYYGMILPALLSSILSPFILLSFTFVYSVGLSVYLYNLSVHKRSQIYLVFVAMLLSGFLLALINGLACPHIPMYDGLSGLILSTAPDSPRIYFVVLLQGSLLLIVAGTMYSTLIRALKHEAQMAKEDNPPTYTWSNALSSFLASHSITAGISILLYEFGVLAHSPLDLFGLISLPTAFRNNVACYINLGIWAGVYILVFLYRTYVTPKREIVGAKLVKSNSEENWQLNQSQADIQESETRSALLDAAPESPK